MLKTTPIFTDESGQIKIYTTIFTTLKVQKVA